jgi:hypothetical protein
MAFVICCVDLTARTRRLMSINDGMAFPHDGPEVHVGHEELFGS